jgi:chemotaxis protein methyltransferase CheR
LAESAQALHRVLYLDPRSVMAEFTLGSLADRDGRSRDSRHHFSTVLRLLSSRNLGEIVPRSDGLTVARLRAVVEKNLGTPVARLQ